LPEPAKTLPVPTDVSPEMQRFIAAPRNPAWNVLWKTGEEWRSAANAQAAKTVKGIPAMRERLHVTVQPGTMDGVKVHVVTPDTIPPGHRDKLLIHVHGGCYVLFPGESGTTEAIIMAGIGHFKVIAVDYRMPPEGYFPAALDDAMTVYKAALKTADPKNMAVFGTSAGTRDLLLSNTVRVHRRLREAGVDAQLEVFEGQSHAQYQFDDRVPETKEAFGEITAFFDKHLGH
jgi:monoterpene epsilon-lactone hydrolase